MVDAYRRKFLNNEIIFNSALFACGCRTTARLDDGQNHEFYSSIGTRKLERKCMLCGSKTFIQGSIKDPGRTTRAK